MSNQINITCAPQISKASCLDVFAPGVFRVPIEVIFIEFRLKWCMGGLIRKINSTGRSVTYSRKH
jgi:hypothetical protein